VYTPATLTTLALYILAAALLYAAEARGKGRAAWALLVALAGLILHGALLFGVIRNEAGYALTIADSASLVGLVIGATAFLAALRIPLGTVPAACFVLAGLLALPTDKPREFHEVVPPAWELKAHIALSALAAGWLLMAALLVLLLALADAELRRPGAARAFGLPPLERQERALFAVLGAGFVALTLSLLTGLVFIHDLFAQHLSYKTVLSALAWVIFAVLLIGRVRYGWRGRRALHYTLAGFATLACAYFGAKFVLEVLLGRHWG
jgi:ABC-type uncharacterized transport system permease subunit